MDKSPNEIQLMARQFLDFMKSQGVIGSVTLFKPGPVSDVSTYSTCDRESQHNFVIQNVLMYTNEIAKRSTAIKLGVASRDAQAAWSKHYPTMKVI